MQTKEIHNILDSMFKNPMLFNKVFGLKNITEVKFMLIADAVSENLELLAEIIDEELNFTTYQAFLCSKSDCAFATLAK